MPLVPSQEPSDTLATGIRPDLAGSRCLDCLSDFIAHDVLSLFQYIILNSSLLFFVPQYPPQVAVSLFREK